MNRKDEHLNLALKYYNENKNDFDKIRFVHNSISNVNFNDVILKTNLGDLKLAHPFYINGMTGGSQKTKEYNRRLAILARETNTMMAVGSMAVALKDKSQIDTFTIVRKENPNGIILANLGADKTLEDAKKVIEMIDADGIQIHLNTLQEIIMPEGDRKYSNWLDNIREIVEGLDVPVIVKEVGFGMSRETIKILNDVGVRNIDISGKGGTNFAKIENSRRKKYSLEFLNNFGNSTVESLIEAQKYINDLNIIASGGIRNSLDIIKSLSLGASAVAMAGRFINLVDKNDIKDAVDIVNSWKSELISIMSLLSAKEIRNLRNKDIIFNEDLYIWCKSRNIDYKNFANRGK